MYNPPMVKRSTEKVIPKKRGRPATGKDPLIALRMSPESRKTVETWARRQDDKPSLSEAIRRLIESGLRHGGK
jgi:hypothetical protein